MAVLKPSDIIARVAIRIGAYQGVPATIESSYSTNPITNLLSESVTPSSLRADTLSTEHEIATIVAGNENHPWRNLIADLTADIASGARIPSVGASAATAKIIGAYGQVKDSATGKPLMRGGLRIEDIIALADNPNSMFTLGMFAAAIRPPLLWHTRTNAKIEVCVFDYTARKTAIDADGELLFPAPDMYFFGLMSKVANTDARLTELSGIYVPKYDAWRQAISSGRNVVAEAGD